jgi:TonB family protein
MVSVTVVALFYAVPKLSAQVASGSKPPKSEVVLSKLFPPVYPRLAQQAQITGDVELALHVRRDGGVESAEVLSGHPMLKQAALDSAKQSQFECRLCGEASTPYSLTYQFRITPRDPPKDCSGTEVEVPPPAEVDISKHQVAVSAWQLWTCDPAVALHRVRSAKCLYLWKCGHRAED